MRRGRICQGSASTSGSSTTAWYSISLPRRVSRSVTPRASVWNAPLSAQPGQVVEIAGLHHQRVAFPVAGRVAQVARAVIRAHHARRQRHDAEERARHILIQEHDFARGLHDLVRRPDARHARRLAAQHRSSFTWPSPGRSTLRQRIPACSADGPAEGVRQARRSRAPAPLPPARQPVTHTEPSGSFCGFRKSMPPPLSQVPLKSGWPSAVRGVARWRVRRHSCHVNAPASTSAAQIRVFILVSPIPPRESSRTGFHDRRQT